MKVVQSTPSSGVPSPCNSVCRMSPTTGFCEGCLRTINEIVAWGQMTDAQKRLVSESLNIRKAQHAA
jgi:uncharacterized protein